MKYPWAQIKAEYVEAVDEASRPSLDELARKYGCHPDYLRTKAGRERWSEQAHIFITKTSQKRQEQKSTALASEQAQWDMECFNVARTALSQIIDHFKKSSAKGEPVKASDLDALTRTLERVQKIGKTSLGDEVNTTGENVVVYLPDNSRDSDRPGT